MRILMLSLDRKILEKDSAVQKRLVALAGRRGTDTERSQHGTDAEDVELVVLVPAERDVKAQVSPHLTVYGVGGSRPAQFFKLWRIGKKILNPPSDKNRRPPLGKGELQRHDLITVQDIHFLGFLAVKLAEKFSLPLEVQVHGFEKMRGVRERLARFVLAQADKIRVVSQRLRESLAKSYKLKPNSLYVLPVYTQMGEKGRRGETRETEEKGERGRKRKTVPYPFTFLTVGRLVPVKNIGLQILAFARLAKEYPQTQLRVVGDGPLEESLKLQVKSLKLDDKIIFEEYQRDLGKYYEEADAFLFTSDYEGWGRVALEAAAHKLPIIMTNVGLANEVLHHNNESVVIPVGDEEQLYLAMKEFVERPELRARLGEAAFRAFMALPSAEEQIRKQVEEWASFI